MLRRCCRAVALCLALMLLWTAPVRAQEEAALPDMEKLTALLDAFTDTMYGRDTAHFAAADAAEQPQIVYGLIWRLLYRGLLPEAGTPVDGVITLTEQQLHTLYGQLFDGGMFVLPAEDCCEMITRTPDGLAFDVSTAAAGMAGMQIMLASGDGESDVQQLMLELYHVDQDYYLFSDDGMLHADWYGGALAEVTRAEDAPLGWRIVSWGNADDLGDGALEQGAAEPKLRACVSDRWGISVMLPEELPEPTETETGLRAQTEDGRVVFTMETRPAAEADLEALLAELAARPDSVTELDVQRQCCTASYEEEGRIITRLGMIAQDTVYVLSFSYPAAEMETYAIYAECMNHSFAITALAVG